MDSVKVLLIKTVVGLLAILPLQFNRLIGRAIGFFIRISHSRMYASAKVNIEHCLPELSSDDKELLLKEICNHLGMTISETAWIWKRSVTTINKHIVEVSGLELLEKNQEQGVILTGPHLGNWELITFWAAQHSNLAAMYRSPKLVALDDLIKSARGKTGAKLISGQRSNVKAMLQQLKFGGAFVILADQEPQKGSGVFAEFYGIPAYTMTLVQKLAQKTKAKILLFSIERVKKGFSIKIEEPEFKESIEDPSLFASALNQSFELLINRNLAQYQWSYKRFKSTPDGSKNFYYK